MEKQKLRSFGGLLIAAAFLLSGRSTWAGTITIGSIGIRPTAEIKKFLPLAYYLGKHLQPEGINQGKVVVVRSIQEMAALMKQGKVDIYIDSSYPAVAVSRLSGSHLLLRRWKKGIGEYKSVIFTRKNSGINRLEDLKGKIIAFEEPYSSSGYFIPKMILSEAGLKLALKSSVMAPVAPEEVGYVFTYEDETTMIWVLRGKAAAGATDNQKYERDAREKIHSLKVLDRSAPFPRQIVSLRAGLAEKLAARIKEILIGMQATEEGKKTLRDFEKTAKFDEIPAPSLARLTKANKWIGLELGLR